MDNDLEQYKAKISSYSVGQLEEILISLNREKFPEKFDIIREALALKTNSGQSAFELPRRDGQEDADKTEVAPPTVDIKPPKQDTKEFVKPEDKTSGPETAETKPLPQVKEKIETLAEPFKSKVKSVKQMIEEEPEEEVPERSGGGGFISGLLGFFVIITSCFALYILLCMSFNLPGKQAIVEIGNKLTDTQNVPDQKTQDEVKPDNQEQSK